MQAVISLLSALVTMDNWHREESEDLVACISVTASALQMQLERGRADLFTPAYLCHVSSCTACQGLGDGLCAPSQSARVNLQAVPSAQSQLVQSSS